MQAKLLLRERQIIGDDRFAEIVIWQLPGGVRGSAHNLKYRLAFVVDDVCVVRFDNEAGKGDHKHIGDAEWPYVFVNPRQLLSDFWDEVKRWRPA